MHEYLKQTIEKFKIKFQGDNKITAMFLYGSVGRDANDEYSDVDLGVVIKDGFYNEVRNNIKG
jgi:predicted nucleotidyltransferase